MNEKLIKLRTERCEIFKNMGYTYDHITGKIYGVKQQEIKRKDGNGYAFLVHKKPDFSLMGHHFCYYIYHGHCNYSQIDHINGIRDDNRIENLRPVTNQENSFNRTKAKGYSWDKSRGKWCSKIKLNGITYNIGCYDNEHEARQSYLKEKQKKHIIKLMKLDEQNGMYGK